MEETEKPRYPKHLDVGRIMIEEISDEQPEMKYPSKPKSTTAMVRRERVTETLKPREKDVENIGKLDPYTRQVEAKKLKKAPWEKPETVERPRKACLKYIHGQNIHNEWSKQFRILHLSSGANNNLLQIFRFYSQISPKPTASLIPTFRVFLLIYVILDW